MQKRLKQEVTIKLMVRNIRVHTLVLAVGIVQGQRINKEGLSPCGSYQPPK